MAGKITITADEFAEKHARRLKAAIPDIIAGVNKVTENPMLKAAAKKDKMRANVNAAIDSGKWEAGLRRTTLTGWQAALTGKGTQRISAGIDGAHDKVVNFATQLLSFESTLKSSVDNMPDLNLQDSLARSAAWITGMSKFVRK